MMDKMEELAARVEAATWPQHDRVLNREVALAVGWCRRTPSQGRTKHPTWFHPDDCRNGEPMLDSLRGTDVWREPLNYLGSLDAAMTLVPEGLKPSIDMLTHDGSTEVEIGYLTSESDNGLASLCCASAATPAIALTAAALRAKIAALRAKAASHE